jgi:hypothetical protein
MLFILFSLLVLATTGYCTVGIATGYGLYDIGVGVQVPAGVKIFLSSTSSKSVLGAYPASCPVHNEISFPGGKAAGA